MSLSGIIYCGDCTHVSPVSQTKTQTHILITTMNTTPNYTKWFAGYNVPRTRSASAPTPQVINPGDILVPKVSKDRGQGQPSDPISINYDEEFSIPYVYNEQGAIVPITAKLTVSYTVEDWGYAALGSDRLIDLTIAKGGSNEPIYGGHKEWSGQAERSISSGDHTLVFHYENIDMPRGINLSICRYSYEAKALEGGGRIAPKPNECGCSDVCNPEGGPGSPTQQTRSNTNNESSSSSSSGTRVVYDVTDDCMLWSCNTGTLRGQGTPLSGMVQLYSDTFGAALASPAALTFNHPMSAKLIIPEGGAVQGAKLEIHFGDRIIALRYYNDGSISPIGVDTAGHGLATPTLAEDGTLTSLKWQEDSGAAWVFDGTTGNLQTYTSAEGVVVSNVASILQEKRATDDSLRQVWSYWDGLVNIEAITETGYCVALYTPDKVAGLDEDGYYTLVEGATPFKSFTITYAESGLTVVERTPGREDYACCWSKADNGAWSIVRGSGTDAISTTRVRSVVEPVTETNPYEVWQMVTTVSKGGVASSCTCDVYQASPMGNLLLTHVEGYGSEDAQTTTYKYDGSGNAIEQVSPNGHKVENEYDSTGRLIRSIAPWRGGDYRQITEYAYAYSGADRYSGELATVTQKLHKQADNSMVVLSTKTYTRSEADGIRREEVRTTAAGSSHTRLVVTEIWTGDAPNALDRGRTRMTQAANGVQTWYSYAATTEHGALYTITSETKVEGEAVAGQSRRSVSYINTEGNTVREEAYILLSSGTWQKLSGSTHSYNVQNQRVGTTRDNGRSSSRDMTCTGEILWEINEDGVRTDYAYDSARRLIEITRAEVRDGETVITPETITEYVRDAAGRVTSTITHTGAMVTTQSTIYDAEGRIVAQTDILGRTTTTTYSADGLTTTTTTPTGATLITMNNTDGSAAEQAGSGQQHLRYRYDLNGNNFRETRLLVQGEGESETETQLSQHTTNGFGETTMQSEASTSGFIYSRSEYNAKGLLTKSYRDTGWNTTPTAATLYEYDSMGQQVKKTLALAEEPSTTNSPIIETAYGAEATESGEVYATTSRTRYNAEGTALTSTQKQLISSLSSTLASKSISVNERGLTTTQWTEYNAGTKRTNSSTIPTSNLTATAVSVDGFTLTQTDHAGITTSQTRAYTSTGMTLTQTDGRGNTTTSITDLAGRAISVADAAGNVTTTAYCTDSDSPATITNAQGKTSCYRYDQRGRKVAEWGTAIQPATFAYDDADRLTALTTFRVNAGDITTDPTERTDGDTTTWTYHTATGLEISKTYADGMGTTKTYDAYNRLATETDGRSITKSHSYEHARGLLLGTTYSDGTTARSYTYNHLGQLTQVTDDAGVRTLCYNAYGEPETDSLLAGGKSHLVTELRDSFGRSSGYTYAKDSTTEQSVSYGYGTDGRLATAAFTHGGESKQFTYGYCAGSNLLQTLTMPNGMSLAQEFETQRDLLTAMLYKRGETGVVERYYTYDSLGRPLTRQENRQGGSRSDSFTHNDRSELTAATLGNAAYSYAYDNIGNRKTAQENAEEATNYDANALNQYTTIGDFEPAYDDAGNQTKVKTSTGIWSVVYNAENRPTSFTNTETNTVIECAYDYMGRRATKKVTVNGGVTLHQRFLYRGYLQIACCDLTRSNHPCLWLITWDPSQPVATRPLAIQKDGTWYTYGWDLTKNICEVYGQHGYIRTNYSYSPYGEVTISGDVTQPIQWSSEYSDSEIDLVYYNYRHYNPTDGRWLSSDSLIYQYPCPNYVYVNNHIVSRFDILGLLDNVSNQRLNLLFGEFEYLARIHLRMIEERLKQDKTLTVKQKNGSIIQAGCVCSVRVTHTYRSPEEQAELYAQGRTKPGKKVTWTKTSIHNFGLAYDLVFICNKTVEVYSGPLMDMAGELGVSLGLVWGGNFKKKKDYPHFEYPIDKIGLNRNNQLKEYIENLKKENKGLPMEHFSDFPYHFESVEKLTTIA